eukprot:2286910-Prymnesium_polylepis.1
MLPSRRHRAGRFDVGELSTGRPAPSGARFNHGWLRGHVEFGLNPLRPTVNRPSAARSAGRGEFLGRRGPNDRPASDPDPDRH